MKLFVVGKIWPMPCGKPSSAGSRVWSSFTRMYSGKNLNHIHLSVPFRGSSAFRTMATFVPCVPFGTILFLLTVCVNIDTITCMLHQARWRPRNAKLLEFYWPSHILTFWYWYSSHRGQTRIVAEEVCGAWDVSETRFSSRYVVLDPRRSRSLMYFARLRSPSHAIISKSPYLYTFILAICYNSHRRKRHMDDEGIDHSCSEAFLPGMLSPLRDSRLF